MFKLSLESVTEQEEYPESDSASLDAELSDINVALESNEAAVKSLLSTIDSDEEFERQVSLEERGAGTLRRITGRIADDYKLMFAWWDSNGKKIAKLRKQLRDIQRRVETATDFPDAPRDNTFVSFLGDGGKSISNFSQLVKEVSKDANDSSTKLTTIMNTIGMFCMRMANNVHEHESNGQWGYDDAVNAAMDAFRTNEGKIIQFTPYEKVGKGYDHNELRVEDGSKFSQLFLGNYTFTSSLEYVSKEAKTNDTLPMQLTTYGHNLGFDFVKVPTYETNTSALSGKVDKAGLLALLKAAGQYLDVADECAKVIKANAMPIIKLRVYSNIFTGALGQSAKIIASRNYRALHVLMFNMGSWAAKPTRKAATRNQDMAKRIIRYVESNSR